LRGTVWEEEGRGAEEGKEEVQRKGRERCWGREGRGAEEGKGEVLRKGRERCRGREGRGAEEGKGEVLRKGREKCRGREGRGAEGRNPLAWCLQEKPQDVAESDGDDEEYDHTMVKESETDESSSFMSSEISGNHQIPSLCAVMA
jgi:hypothetical protein